MLESQSKGIIEQMLGTLGFIMKQWKVLKTFKQ